MTADDTAPPGRTDAEYLAAFKQGDASALASFLESVVPALKWLLRKKLGIDPDDEIVHDAIQTGAVRLWTRPGIYDPKKGRMDCYFGRIVENECRRRLRARRADSLLAFRPGELLEAGEPVTRPSAEFSVGLRAFLASLSDLERRILAADLRNGESVPAAALAREFETTRDTIYALRNRTKKKVRDYYRDEQRHGERDDEPRP